jgi:hypothetical protein
MQKVSKFVRPGAFLDSKSDVGEDGVWCPLANLSEALLE